MKEFNINGTLLSISQEARELNNEKKTKYHLANVAVIVKGQKRVVTAQVWGSIKDRLTIDRQYTMKAKIMDNGRVLFSVVPFVVGSEALTAADFGFDSVPASTTGAAV